MTWEIEYTDEFEEWWKTLREGEQDAVAVSAEVLAEHGPSLPFPHSSGVRGSRHRQMRELRVQHRGRPYRVLYAFDPRRVAILLIGGSKAGNDRFYEELVPKADRIYEQHLRELEQRGGTRNG